LGEGGTLVTYSSDGTFTLTEANIIAHFLIVAGGVHRDMFLQEEAEVEVL